MEFKSGFIALLGSPNVGKSTLLNALIGTKIAIVSKKPQTTRNKIVGITTTKDFQMIFLDTPGLHTPKNKLDEFMQSTAQSAARDVDAILFIVDAKTGARERDTEILTNLKKGKVPVVIAINKIDAVDEERVLEVEEYLKQFDEKILRISALQNLGLTSMVEDLKHYLIEGTMYYQ
ncbi:MAG: GTPase Era, partial [Christensenellaceae bacterium]